MIIILSNREVRIWGWFAAGHPEPSPPPSPAPKLDMILYMGDEGPPVTILILKWTVSREILYLFLFIETRPFSRNTKRNKVIVNPSNLQGVCFEFDYLDIMFAMKLWFIDIGARWSLSIKKNIIDKKICPEPVAWEWDMFSQSLS